MKISPKLLIANFTLITALSGLTSCAQGAPTDQPTNMQAPAAITVAALASATPRPTTLPTAKPTQPLLLESDRQIVEGAFSFIAPTGYETEIEKISAFFNHAQDNIFFSLTLFETGDDERTARGKLEQIFAKFDGVDIGSPAPIIVNDLNGLQADFNGILQPAVVSGTYAIIELENGISFLAFGMGNVTQDFDSWESYGKRDFDLLLQTVQLGRFTAAIRAV